MGKCISGRFVRTAGRGCGVAQRHVFLAPHGPVGTQIKGFALLMADAVQQVQENLQHSCSSIYVCISIYTNMCVSMFVCGYECAYADARICA